MISQAARPPNMLVKTTVIASHFERAGPYPLCAPKPDFGRRQTLNEGRYKVDAGDVVVG